jgi:hypothetical protein
MNINVFDAFPKYLEKDLCVCADGKDPCFGLDCNLHYKQVMIINENPKQRKNFLVSL